MTWVGLSMGAMVGQGLAIRHPELVSRLVLANTTASIRRPRSRAGRSASPPCGRSGMAAVAEKVVERYLHADFRAAHPAATEAIRQRLLRNDPAGYAASCHAVANVDWLDRLAQVRCPTLVIAGARDAGAPPAMGQAIAERIPGAVLQVIEDASHLSVLETPDEFRRLMDDFLRPAG